MLAEVDNMDITPLVYSYHRNVDYIRVRLQGYKTTEQPKQLLVKTDYTYSKYEELKKLVYAVKPKGTCKWSVKYSLKQALLGVLYIAMWKTFFTNPSILLSIILGVFAMSWCGLVTHEGSHASISKYPIVNWILALSLNPFASTAMWHMDHNLRHHPFTNTDYDNDFVAFSALELGRYSKYHPYRWFYRYQQYYIFVFYPFIVFTKGIYRSLTEFYKFSTKSCFEYVFHIVSFFTVIALAAWYGLLLNLFVLICSFGITFMLFTQVNHIVESAVTINDEGERGNDFLVRQVEASINYKCGTIMEFLCFGLHNQIEHHLFPSMAHEHYDAIAPIVKTFCKDHGIKYVQYDSFWIIFKQFMHYVKQMGRA